MTKDKLFQMLTQLQKKDLICYIYRESVLEILNADKVESRVYLITDSTLDKVRTVFSECGIVETPPSKGKRYFGKYESLMLDVLCCDEITEEDIKDILRMDLTVHSMMMRANGEIYDVNGGLDDYHNKIIRTTEKDIKFKESVSYAAMVLVIKYGFTADKDTFHNLNGAIKALPVNRRTGIINVFRNSLKSEDINGERILNALKFYGFFSNAGKVSLNKAKEFESKIRSMKPIHRSALAIYLCDISPEELKTISNTGFAREFYECFLNFINANINDKHILLEAKKHCTPECFETLLAVKETLCLIKGEEYITPNINLENVFKNLEKSNVWSSPNLDLKSDILPVPVNSKETVADEEDEDDDGHMEEFGGEEEEKYVVEDEETSEHVEQSGTFRTSANNFHVGN